MNNEKEKTTQELKEENLNLVIKNNDWATSPTTSLSLYKENEDFDSANR